MRLLPLLSALAVGGGLGLGPLTAQDAPSAGESAAPAEAPALPQLPRTGPTPDPAAPVDPAAPAEGAPPGPLPALPQPDPDAPDGSPAEGRDGAGGEAPAVPPANPHQPVEAQPAGKEAWSRLLADSWTSSPADRADRPTHLFSFGRDGRFRAARLRGERLDQVFTGRWWIADDVLVTRVEQFDDQPDWVGREFRDRLQLMEDDSLLLSSQPVGNAEPAAPAEVQRLTRHRGWY